MARWRDSEHGYGVFSVLCHWLVALLVIVNLALGLYATDLPRGSLRGEMLALHKSIGVVAVGAIGVRLLWRVRYGFVGLPPFAGSLQRALARPVHVALLLLLVLMPLSGYLGGHAITVFNLFYLEAPHQNKPLAIAMHAVHANGATILIALLLMHVLAACKHHFLDRDGTMRRILLRSSPVSDR